MLFLAQDRYIYIIDIDIFPGPCTARDGALATARSWVRRAMSKPTPRRALERNLKPWPSHLRRKHDTSLQISFHVSSLIRALYRHPKPPRLELRSIQSLGRHGAKLNGLVRLHPIRCPSHTDLLHPLLARLALVRM